jgi:type I restriction-modification system DNA methylase subunit
MEGDAGSGKVPEAVISLVHSFDFHLPAYKRGQYNEMQLRQEFIDPFFKALGWDVDNNKRYSELYKEVIHEDPIRIRGSTEFIDYSFRIGGMRKFIVEAKKPAVNIRDDPAPALQIRRYAWNARLPLCILTDFEEFAVYDCTKKPMPGDTAATARIEYFTYKDYPEKWKWISSVFSQECILQGSFDRFAAGTKGKKGTATVDEAILADIEEWRDILAKNLALRNPALSVDELNVAVQRTIDRILFLRICEDRGIEEYGCLQNLLEGEGIYQRLVGMFQRADTIYNSGIFHFSQEPGWDELPDTITPGLIIDDAVLKKIIKRLYYPESPYEFSVISPVILGQVYEQFLGKVIRFTAGHQAKVEYKPEVKKAGGVYYTPQYIVDYIVKHTVGELVKDKTPRDVSKLRVLDPACGSGSFLLGAFQYLLDWHLEYYIHTLVPVLADKPATAPEVQALLPEPPPKSGRKRSGSDHVLPIYKAGNGKTVRVRTEWKLTTAERKRILLNNIYGVDIDTQAVEVTKLSLLLKVLEETSEENISKQLKISDERALPSLHENIKCGNSLIGTDIYADVQVTLDDPEAAKRINAFDWDREFPEIMQRGGFDAVIGNPPYIRIQTMKEWAPMEAEFYKKHFFSASKGNYDIYVVFVEKGLSLLNKNGLVGYILPHKFFNAKYGEPLRTLIANGKHLKEIVHFGHQQIFENATTYTSLLFLGKHGFNEFFFAKVENLNEWRSTYAAIEGIIQSKYVTEKDWNFVVGDDSQLFTKLSEIPCRLDNISENIFQGLVTSADPVYFLDPIGEEQNGLIKVKSKATEKEYFLESKVVVPLCKGALDIRRYSIIPSKRVIFPYDVELTIKNGKTTLISSKKFFEQYPNTWAYLKENFELLRNREKGKMRNDSWYGYIYPKSVSLFSISKILTPSIAQNNSFSLDLKGEFYFAGSGGGGGGGYGIILNKNYKMSEKYILGLLNSKVLNYFLKKISSTFRGGYFACNRQYIEQLPIRTIDFSDPADKDRHDKMVALVERMLTLHKQRAEVKTDHDKNLIERQIEGTDKQIDALVYELYGLTEEEIKIVEGAGK